MTAKQGPEGTLSYTYYNHGELESVKSSITNGTNVSYTYDSLNRLTTVNDTHWTGNTSYTYDPFGNLASVNKPNGESVTYTYDVLNRLNSMAATVNGSSIRSYTYTLGPNGNRTNVAELSNRAVTYTYDDLYRLTGEIVSSDPATQNIGAISYQYDAVGNRTNRTSGITAISSQSPSYDAGGDDRMTSDGTSSYSYDANGSTTQIGPNTYAFDSLGRMTQATVGTTTTTYVYDGDGNKIQQVVNNGTGPVTTSYLVDSTNPTGYAQVLEENQGSGVNLVYTYGSSRISEDQYNGTSWNLSFYGYDGQGSVRYLTDSTGTKTDTYDYDAFGTLINQTHTGPPTPNEMFFDAEQLDGNTGFYNLRARWMNPGIGRFQTMDSYEGDNQDPLSLHKYLFVENDPVNKLDPSGNDSMVKGQAIDDLLKGIFHFPVNLDYPLLSKEFRQIVGLIFAESSTKGWNGIEDMGEQTAIGLTFENRAYYARKYPEPGNAGFGDGTLLSAIINGSAAYNDTQWKWVMSSDDLKTKGEIEKILPDSANREHFNDAVQVAYSLSQLNFPATYLPLDPWIPPVEIRTYPILIDNPRYKYLGLSGSTNFWGFIPGREKN